MPQELQVIGDFYDLMVYLNRRVEKFPRSHRFTLGADVERRLQTVLGQLIRAKYAHGGEAKRALLIDVNVELEILRFQLRLAKDLTVLPLNSHGHANRLVNAVGVQIGGWLRALRLPGVA